MTEHWQANREEAYLAAQMVCLDGAVGSAIAKELFPNLIEAHKQPLAIERVKTLLRYAHEHGILKLEPTRDEKVESDLKRAFGSEFNFHVVKNESEHVAALRSDAICLEAAKVVANKIYDKLRDASPNDTVVVANAGGPAVSAIVRHLPGRKLIPDPTSSERLLFISLNSASIPTNYGYSANVLAVRMADMYGGRHIVLTPILAARSQRRLPSSFGPDRCLGLRRRHSEWAFFFLAPTSGRAN